MFYEVRYSSFSALVSAYDVLCWIVSSAAFTLFSFAFDVKWLVGGDLSARILCLLRCRLPILVRVRVTCSCRARSRGILSHLMLVTV
jgi:hypothetical protein